jgi:nucleoside-diphosphate-sugar epimerase
MSFDVDGLLDTLAEKIVAKLRATPPAGPAYYTAEDNPLQLSPAAWRERMRVLGVPAVRAGRRDHWRRDLVDAALAAAEHAPKPPRRRRRVDPTAPPANDLAVAAARAAGFVVLDAAPPPKVAIGPRGARR